MAATLSPVKILGASEIRKLILENDTVILLLLKQKVSILMRFKIIESKID